MRPWGGGPTTPVPAAVTLHPYVLLNLRPSIACERIRANPAWRGFTLPGVASSKGLVDLMVDKETIMRMFDVQAVEIAAPRSKEFEFLAQPGNLPLWAHAFVSADVVAPDSRRPTERSTSVWRFRQTPRRAS